MPQPLKINRITAEQVEQFRKMYLEGITFSEIGRQFGYNRTTIKFHLGQLERKPKEQKRLKNNFKKFVAKKQELSYAEICEKQSKINLIRDENGLIEGIDF